MRNRLFVALLAVVSAGCAGPREPIPITPRADVPTAPVVRRPLSEPSTATAPHAAAPPTSAFTAPIVPPDALYVCVSEDAGQRRQTTIEFAPKVAALCKRHPEMGPCQYERDVCRRSGGRVYAASGMEITRQIEQEYDRKVMRVRFRAN